jgi:hypothetical protein
MKRLGAFFSAVLLASLISGCTDSGIQEGMSTDPVPENNITPSMKKMMEENAAKMQMKGKTGPPAESKKAAEAAKAEAAAEKPKS